ncbi:cytochrome P450 [Lepidopterella palustris CBS 459.81]|uniref:Cytochrome P450 n=1 Tax=Lepidopterella palustris CBS 459.81 TaxID=1314670 RepID=A0A8E2DXF4_9PEZI|nr:cytochrome P450 [Lepidopterella palustris CBS 459.81]
MTTLFRVRKSKWVYNVYLHPLSKYPGPKFAAASRLPLAWALVTGNNIRWTTHLHDVYGHVVRVAPNEISYTDGQGWKDIYGHRIGAKSSMTKHPGFYSSAVNGAHSIVTAPDDADHARGRRVFSNAFSDKALREQEPLFRKYVNLLIHKLRLKLQDDPNKPINIVNMYNFTTFDVLGDLTFGEPLQLLETSEYTPWVALIFDSIKAATIFSTLRRFPIFENLMKALLPKSLRQKRREHFEYASDRVKRRLAQDTKRPDIWTLVLRQVEGKGLSDEEMHANAAVFMIAGTETTATLLSGLTYFLLKNPSTMAKLVTEIRGAFAADEDITIEALARLEYLTACCEEALRMYPPVPAGMPRVVSSEGAIICGNFVPGGTTVYVSIFATNHSEANFKHHNSFIPERWTGDERFASDNKFAFQPFSYGPRNCIGKNMAYHEMRLILSKVLWNFNLTLFSEMDDWAHQDVFTLWQKHPLMVKLTPVRGP